MQGDGPLPSLENVSAVTRGVGSGPDLERSDMRLRRGSSAVLKVDGAHVLYHYLQKDLLKNDIWLFQMLTARLVVALGIWFSPLTYERLPILLPYAVRDPKCRGDRRKGIPDEWGSPNREGYFRDDNSLIKGIPRSLTIKNPSNVLYDGLRIGPGFVASHVWRVLSSGDLASRDPRTYSFVPNLVWLPTQVSKLTDREGSFVQTYLQALSRKIYAGVQLPPGLRDIAEEAWAKLPLPSGVPEQGLPAIDELNFFDPTPSFFERRLRTTELVRDRLVDLENDSRTSVKLIASRYGEGLNQMKPRDVAWLRDDLTSYCNAVRASSLGQ